MLLPAGLFAEEVGKIAGQIIDKANGKSLFNANVVLIARWKDNKKVEPDTLIGTSTDKNGRYLISGLEPGKYTIEVSYMGYSSEVRNKVEVKTGRITRVNFGLVFQSIKGKRVTVITNRYSRTADYSNIAAKLPLAIHKTPLSVDVVTQKVLKEQQASILSDALKNSISINIQNSLGTRDYFLIRGFDSNSAGLVLIDGISVPDASPFKFYGFGFYNLYNVEQVEVLKGPAAFLYGGNTLSGAVHLVRKSPRFKNFGRCNIFHSRYNSYQETLDLNYYNEELDYAFRLNGLYQMSRRARKHNENNTFAINPSFSWKPNNFSILTVNIEYKLENIKPDAGIPLYNPDGEWKFPPNIPRNSSYQTDFDKSIYNNYRLRINYRRDISENRQLKYIFFMNYLDSKSRFTLPLIPHRFFASWIVPRNMYTIGQQQRVFGNQLEFHQTWNTDRLKHNILWGFEGVYTDNATLKKPTIIKSITLFSQEEIETENFNELITFPPVETNTSQRILAAYMVDYISLWENFQLFTGSRIDYIDYYTDRRNASFDYIGRSLSSTPVPFSQNFLKFSPMLGLVLKESENLWFYANAGRAFASGQRIASEPEFSTQFEVGYRYKSKNNRIKTSASLFSIKKENMTIPMTGPLQGNVYASTGSQKATGFEFEFITQSVNNWFLSLKNAYTYAEYINYKALTATDNVKLTLSDFSGNVPLFVPARILYIKLHRDFNCGLNFGLGLRYVGDQYANYENDYEIDSYRIYQTHIGYQWQHWLFQVNVNKISRDNLLSRGLGPYSVIPVVPLEISGSIEASF